MEIMLFRHSCVFSRPLKILRNLIRKEVNSTRGLHNSFSMHALITALRSDLISMVAV